MRGRKKGHDIYQWHQQADGIFCVDRYWYTLDGNRIREVAATFKKQQDAIDWCTERNNEVTKNMQEGGTE